MTDDYDGRCLICGGRGAWPTTYTEDWVPWTACSRCDGTGFDPSAEVHRLLGGNA